MEAFQDFEEKITCPYDKAHFIRKSKMNVHLVKCSKNFPDAEIVICDFNSTHRIPKPELRYHHDICPDRRKVENHIIQVEDEDSSNIYPVENIQIDEEENWDCEPEHPGYDPGNYCARNNVLRHMDVLSAAKRRNFRLEERERLNQYRSAESSNIDKNSATGSGSVLSGSRGAWQPQHTSNIRVEEEAPHLSLAERIKSGHKKTYEPHN